MAGRDPFAGLAISDDAPLRACASRFACPECEKTAMYYCPRCLVPAPALAGRLPAVRLPFRRLVVVKDVRERDAKSTALHAKVLAPGQVEVVAYARESPEPPAVLSDLDPATTAVLFPSPDAEVVSEASFALECGCVSGCGASGAAPISAVIVIDGTWRQARALARSPALARFPRHLALDARPGGETLFWRYQAVGPHCLATIEAVHRLCGAAACGAHGACVDDLLFFFAFFFRRIQREYRDTGRAFTSRRGEGYIRSD